MASLFYSLTACCCFEGSLALSVLYRSTMSPNLRQSRPRSDLVFILHKSRQPSSLASYFIKPFLEQAKLGSCPSGWFLWFARALRPRRHIWRWCGLCFRLMVLVDASQRVSQRAARFTRGVQRESTART